MSLDDIWREPLVETPIIRSNITAADGSSSFRPALFLSDSDDDDMPRTRESSTSPSPHNNKNRAPQAPDKEQLDALFGNLDDEEDIFADVGAVDIEKLKRQAEAKVTAKRGALPSTAAPTPIDEGSSQSRPAQTGGNGTKRRELPKLNEERLLGNDGFLRLLKEYKNFKPSGKGHEVADLEKLFRLYHGWTHKLFPKYQFRDAVERIEKLCRSRRMMVNLRVWKDEVHGIPSENRHDVTGDSGDSARDSQSDDEQSRPRTKDDINEQVNGKVLSTSSRPSTPITRPGSVASTALSVPSSATDMDDMQIDALLREEEDLMREMGNAKKKSYKPVEDDDEEGLWAAAGGIPDINSDVGAKAPGGDADDEDMWNIVDEMIQEPTTLVSQQPNKGANLTIGADWDDMYE